MAVGTRKVDCGCCIEFFGLIHKIRESTYDLIEGILQWQHAFTHNIRPQLMSVDYLVKMVHSLDFISGSSLRRTFTFSLSAYGNIFILAQPIISTSKPPNKCDDTLMDLVHHFANPDELRMINCYKIMKNCMPSKEFDRLMPISYWMNNKWKPHIMRTSLTEADRWYLTGGEDKEEVVQVHKNFLRKKPAANMPGLGKKSGLGDKRKTRKDEPGTSRLGGDGDGAGVDKTGVGATASMSERKASMVNGSSQSGATTAKDATTGMTTDTESNLNSPEKKKSPSKKGKKQQEDSDSEDEKHKAPIVDFTKIIQDTFKGAPIESFGAWTDPSKSYNRSKAYEGQQNCTFSVDHLLDEVDSLGLELNKKKPNYLAMSKAKLAAKKNAYSDAEDARIKAELAARKAAKGLNAARPPTPPRTSRRQLKK
jgi:hypothetical protein